MLHGIGIFTCIWLKFMVNVGKYSSHMGHLGKRSFASPMALRFVGVAMMDEFPPWNTCFDAHSSNCFFSSGALLERKDASPQQ